MRIFGVLSVICVGLVTADFRQDALDLHNSYRAKHGSPALSQNAQVISI